MVLLLNKCDLIPTWVTVSVTHSGGSRGVPWVLRKPPFCRFARMRRLFLLSYWCQIKRVYTVATLPPHYSLFPSPSPSPSLSLSSPDSLGDSAVLRIPHSGLPLQPHQPLWEGIPHTSTETVCQGKAVEREEGGGRREEREREKREGGMKIHSPSEAVSHGRVIGRNWFFIPI